MHRPQIASSLIRGGGLIAISSGSICGPPSNGKQIKFPGQSMRAPIRVFRRESPALIKPATWVISSVTHEFGSLPSVDYYQSSARTENRETLSETASYLSIHQLLLALWECLHAWLATLYRFGRLETVMEHGESMGRWVERGKDFPLIPIFLIIGEQLLIFDKFNLIEEQFLLFLFYYLFRIIYVKICRKDEA